MTHASGESRITRGVALWISLGALSVVVLLGVLVAVQWGPLLSFDRAVDTPLHAWALDNPGVVSVSRWLETIGRVTVSFWVVLATTVVLLAGRRWRPALALVLTAVLAPVITDHLKPVVGRARPTWDAALGSEGTLSYPSGHATAGIAVYVACGLALATLVQDRRAKTAVIAVFGVVGVAIGLSRLVLGVHWPSDVVGGWGVALAVGAALVGLLVLGRPRRSEQDG